MKNVRMQMLKQKDLIQGKKMPLKVKPNVMFFW